jgi:tetratricopeptide (TPR) repeat protein
MVREAKRRMDVMLSSTFFDLEEKRRVVLDQMGRHDFHDIVMENDAALPTMDKIDSSLFKVDRAEAYICIIGHRYGTRQFCKDRNPDNWSLTELEFRHAQKRGIPRCTFIMSGNYIGIPLSHSEAVSDEDKASLAAFRKLAEADRVYASFDNDTQFALRAMQSLSQLRDDLDARQAARPATAALSSSPDPAPTPDDDLPPWPPAFHYVRRPYLERQAFAGRVKELDLIDSWAIGPDAMLLFQAIGGMGKSMLTWHWVKNRAAKVRTDWAGQFWYSFYEQGADLNDFCVQALAYIRHQPPRTFRVRGTFDLGYELRRELDAQPWLLVLDGLERVLVAYNRAGKEHMSDEDAAVVRDDLGLDREPRSCFRPDDDDVLSMMAQAGQGKLLTSSRLTPTALTTWSNQLIPGVAYVGLEGLEPEDAEQMLRHARVHGNSERIRRFLQEQFACHPLSVRAVTGQVSKFLDARGDFDRWVEHPKGGANPALIANDLRGRQNHILAQAFDGLDGDAKALLGSLALANIELAPDILRILNPMRRVEPKKMEPPVRWSNEELYENTADKNIDEAFDAWRTAGTSRDRADAQKKLDEYHEQTFKERKRSYGRMEAAHRAWQKQAARADAWLEQTLPDLEARGLLQYDAETGGLDMHPAIRHTVLVGLSSDARERTGSHVSDALSSRPVKPYKDARSVDDLALSITHVKALNAAGKYTAGWDLLVPDLANSLTRLERDDVLVEIMQTYFPQGWDEPPRAVTPSERENDAVFSWAAAALFGSEHTTVKRKLQEKGLKYQLERGYSSNVCIYLSNLTFTESDPHRVIHQSRLLLLVGRLADASGEPNALAAFATAQATYYLERGKLDASQSSLDALLHAVELERISDDLQARLADLRLGLAFRSGRITAEIVNDSLALVHSLGHVSWERVMLETVARWHQLRGAHEQALDVFNEMIALANKTVARSIVSLYHARRALSLTALGRTEEASQAIRKFEQEYKKPNLLSALNYLELGEKQKAREHILGAYKSWWADGPPHHYHWGLEDCRKVLAALGEPEPVLPVVDPATVKPFDFEADVERLIEKKLVEKAEREGNYRNHPPE